MEETKVLQALSQFLIALDLEPHTFEDMSRKMGHSTNLQIVEEGLKIAHAAIVLITPDEIAQLRERYALPGERAEFELQPRPNVLF